MLKFSHLSKILPLSPLPGQLGTEHYIYLRSDPGRSILGRKGADSGVCVVKTRTAVLVGTYSAGIQPANCNAVMEKMADYLIQNDL